MRKKHLNAWPTTWLHEQVNFLQHLHFQAWSRLYTNLANHIFVDSILWDAFTKQCSNSVAEINAKRKQKELEESAAQYVDKYPSNTLCEDSLYDEIPANNKQVFATQPCPAYAPLPPPRMWMNNHHLPAAVNKINAIIIISNSYNVCVYFDSFISWTYIIVHRIIKL